MLTNLCQLCVYKIPRKAAVISGPMCSLRIRHTDPENVSQPLCQCEAPYGNTYHKESDQRRRTNFTHLYQFFPPTQDRHEAT